MFLAETIGADQMGNLYECGEKLFKFSGTIPFAVHTIVIIIKIVVPVILIIFGMIDFLKAVTAAKEDEIKKGQQTFIKRLIAAVLVFFIVQIVQIVIRFVSSSNTNVVNCFNCFVNGTISDNGCVDTGEAETE